jgi:hypothetical protein
MCRDFVKQARYKNKSKKREDKGGGREQKYR